jgi:Ca2+-binding RTX toxin-like protein
MSADSLVSSVDGFQAITGTSKDVINNFLHDTQDGDVTKTDVGGGTMVSGLGTNNELQDVIIANSTSTPLDISSGGFNASIQVGTSNAVITLEGPGAPQATPDDFFRLVVDTVVGSTAPGAAELNASLNQAIDQVATAGNIIKVIQVVDTQNVTITGSGSGNEVVALNISDTTGSVTVNGLDKVIVAGSGQVIITGSTDTAISGDLRDQAITGGAGNDTIFGGAGSDTIIGGAGSDVFGFVGGAGTSTIIADAGAGDTFNIQMNGVSNWADLVASVTKIDTSNGNFMATFADGSSITLVGVSPDAILESLFHFS